MTRVVGTSPIALFAFVISLALTAWALQAGLASDDAVRLWAGASGAGDGQVAIGRIAASRSADPFG